MLDKRTSVGFDLSLKALAVGLMLTAAALGAIVGLSYSFLTKHSYSTINSQRFTQNTLLRNVKESVAALAELKYTANLSASITSSLVNGKLV